MKRNFVGIVVLAVMTMVSSAYAGMSVGYSDGTKGYGMNTDKYGNMYNLGASYNTTESSIDYTSVNYVVTSPTQVSVYDDFGGWAGTSPTDTVNGGLSLNSGKGDVSENMSSNYYDDNNSGKGIAPLTSDGTPNWRATAYANVSFPATGVSWVSGNCNYSTYSYPGQPDQFSFNANWQVNFTDPTATANFVDSLVDMGATVTNSSGIPEPASIGLLGVGAAALLVRRRHQW